MLDRLRHEPPHNHEVEQALLGAILLDNATLDRVAGVVEADDFGESLHAHIFATAAAMHRDGTVATATTMRPHFADFPDVADGLPVWKYLGRLVVAATTLANAVCYAETVREYAARRRLFDAGHELLTAAADARLPVSETAGLAVEALDHVLSIARAKSRTRTDMGVAMSDALNELATDTGADRITTGLTDLDKLTGGWRRKQVAIIGGRPSMGKSTIANACMLRTAKAGHGVLCFSLEMSTASLAARCLSDLSWSPNRRIAYADAMAARISDLDMQLLAQTAAHYRTLPLVIDDQRGLTMAEIGARTRAEAQRMERAGRRLGLVVVDHLGLIKPSARYAGNKVQEVGEISDGLCALAKDQDVAVLALHQLNRGTEGRENKRPTLADLRNSGDLEQDADVVCFAYRESYYLERSKNDPGSQAELQRQTALDACRNTLELLIAKNRNGPTQPITLFCDMACNVVRDLS